MPTPRPARWALRHVAVVLAALLAVQGVALARAAHSAAATALTVATFNTKHGTSQFPNLADVIGWQELDNDASFNRMRSTLTYYSHSACNAEGPAMEDRISVRTNKFDAGQCEATRTHPGESGVTPARYIVSQILTYKDTGEKFAFVDTHFISGAFSGHPERQDRWYAHADKLREVVKGLQDRGLRVVVVGDFNRQKVIPLSGLEHYDTGGSDTPIDQIYATPSIKTGGATRDPNSYGSDHHPYTATIRV